MERLSDFCLETVIKESGMCTKHLLEELQMYRRLGTLEKCQEAVIKQKPTKASYHKLNEPLCPYCYKRIEDGDIICDCGQRIKWEQ